MITIQHNRAKFTVQPENAQATYDLLAIIDKSKGKKGRKLAQDKGMAKHDSHLLAIIDKSKGKKGRKLAQDKGMAKHDSRKREFPQFNPACMLTSDYVTAYVALNHARLHLAPLKIKPTVNRTPPELDPTVPEVVEELCEQ